MTQPFGGVQQCDMADELISVGWREWVGLPELGIPSIKAKVDTGARTSALHTFDLETYQDAGSLMVRFKVHPIQLREDIVLECHAPVADEREVTDSGGHKEQRYVINTLLTLGKYEQVIEMTLTNRDTMRFRMLIGRTTLSDQYVVKPSASYLLGKPDMGKLAVEYGVKDVREEKIK